MNKTFKRILCILLVLCMTLAVLASCNKNKDDGNVNENSGDSSNQGNQNNSQSTVKKDYTYRTATTALATNWNPHSWENNADDSVLSYLSAPFCTMSVLDSEEGIYQWVYDMATSITDVTKDHQSDLTKYKVKLPTGQTAETTEKGFVFEIKLNPDAKWENGENITADDYIESMKLLLDSKMRNYRANLYYSGESAVAGGLAYYNSEAPLYSDICADGEYLSTDDKLAAGNLYFSLSKACAFFGSYSAADYYNAGYTVNFKDGEGVDLYKKWENKKNSFGYIAITNENYAEVVADLCTISANFGDDKSEAWKEWSFYISGTGDKVSYDTVGCYKVDDYTIRYVCASQIDINYFLTSCTSTWLVYVPMYEANFDTTGELKTTKYMSSKETSISYGPYKLESVQEAKQMIFVQNENWYGWERNEDGTLKKDEEGNLISMTNFKVDGEYQRQYVTTKVVIDVLDPEQEKQAFLKGELSEWGPSASDLSTYTTSDQLYQVAETHTMSFFFNCGLETLQQLDADNVNENGVVLSSTNFRKAMSLAINRAKFVTATAGYVPSYAIMNSLYFYDVYNDPTSSYRSSDVAMQAICNLYGVEYGAGTPYATLKDAYNSITGYNLTEAKTLMKAACQELVEAGLYTEGSNIKIKIAYSAGALTDDNNQQVALLNEFVNAALEGSGFGQVTFEAVGNLENRYGDVPAGKYAIGYGAWGGAAFYPFRNFQIYCDPDQYDVHELGCWDPTAETLTLTVNDEEVTMTWQEWSIALISGGRFANESNEVKLAITAAMEEAYLKFYYRIPLCSTASCFLTSYQLKYYTEEYNIMYGFGGFRLMSYTMDDAAWAAYVAGEGGTLSYE